MKHTFVFVLLFFSLAVFGQESKSQMFMIHEDQVSPAMMMRYEHTAKTLQGYLKEHKVTDMSFAVGMTDNLNYFYVSPIENHAAIDEMGKPWGALTEKVGKEKMDAMWEKFDACYDVHRNYIMTLSDELSYTPSGDAMEDDGRNARKWTYIYAHPKHIKDMYEVSKKWKKLYEDNNLKEGYRVYIGGLGLEYGTMLIVNWGKDVADITTKEKKSQEILGDAGYKLWQESAQYIRKMEVKYGGMRPDLGYSPE